MLQKPIINKNNHEGKKSALINGTVYDFISCLFAFLEVWWSVPFGLEDKKLKKASSPRTYMCVYWWGVAIITADIFTWVTCSFLETLDLLAGNMFSSLSLSDMLCGGFSLLNALQKNAGAERRKRERWSPKKSIYSGQQCIICCRARSPSHLSPDHFSHYPFPRGAIQPPTLDVHTHTDTCIGDFFCAQEEPSKINWSAAPDNAHIHHHKKMRKIGFRSFKNVFFNSESWYIKIISNFAHGSK